MVRDKRDHQQPKHERLHGANERFIKINDDRNGEGPQPVIQVKSHVQHRLPGKNIAVKTHGQRHRTRKKDGDRFHQANEKEQQEHDRINGLADFHFHAENVLSESPYPVVTDRPIHAHDQKNHRHGHGEVGISSRRTEKRRVNAMDGKGQNAVFIRRSVADACLRPEPGPHNCT